MTSTRRRLVPVLSLASLALTTVIGTAGAAEAAPRRVISACYSVETGKIRIVESIADCRPAESHIRWSRPAQGSKDGKDGKDGGKSGKDGGKGGGKDGGKDDKGGKGGDKGGDKDG